jgi:hypothetical protein
MRRLSLGRVGLMSGLLLVWIATLEGMQVPASVRAIDPGSVRLPPEESTAGITRFSFIAYGDTRGEADGLELQREHGRIVEAMLAEIRDRASGDHPVRFVVQSGDGVTAGSDAAQWDISFTPLIDTLVREGGVPYFLSVGNHDVSGRPASDPQRQPGLRNTLAVMSKLYPPDGSPRRLNGYPTYAFGYGHVFVLVIDSNIASDQTQLEWATRQLEELDRSRFPLVIAVFHHPPFSSGPHGGPTVESWTSDLRRLYQPLFRKHRVRMTITGHDHLYEHWIERYREPSGTYRMDHLVTGGGGAPIYTYRGEPNLEPYVEAALPTDVTLEHKVKPGLTPVENPHHFVIVQVDGEKLTLEVVATSDPAYRPYGERRIELSDR